MDAEISDIPACLHHLTWRAGCRRLGNNCQRACTAASPANAGTPGELQIRKGQRFSTGAATGVQCISLSQTTLNSIRLSVCGLKSGHPCFLAVLKIGHLICLLCGLPETSQRLVVCCLGSILPDPQISRRCELDRGCRRYRRLARRIFFASILKLHFHNPEPPPRQAVGICLESDDRRHLRQGKARRRRHQIYVEILSTAW